MLLPIGFTCRKEKYCVLFDYDSVKYKRYLRESHSCPHNDEDEFVDFYCQLLHCGYSHHVRQYVRNYQHNHMRLMFDMMSYIRRCIHWEQRSATCRASRILPIELVLIIRDKISSATALALFDKAWDIKPCSSLFCHSYVADVWFEQCIDVMSTAEQESITRNRATVPSTRSLPCYYCIIPTEYGLKMWVLKLSPITERQGYGYQRLFQDPLTGIHSFVPVCCYVAPSPQFMEKKHNTKWLHEPLNQVLRSQFLKCQRYFDLLNRHKRLYPGYDTDMNSCWIYPWSESSTNLKYPCIEWTQIIYDVYCYYRSI